MYTITNIMHKLTTLIQTITMSCNPSIDNLVQSSILEWIPYEQITNIQIDNVYKYTLYDGRIKEMTIMLLLLGSNETCTPTIVSEFARIYSLPTNKYDNDDSQFRRYSKWLKERNEWIKGFTRHEDNYYMVA